jgi:nucleoside diphosphate kinase/thiol-disulfide isomerase/thioredoxin
MAGRGRTKEMALQAEVESQEDWEETISKEGLTVVDVYQEWCGPCKAIVSTFKRIKNESGDDMLRFAMAKCDSIESLERYRGKCEPCFLFYASGALVAVVRGANCPLLTTTILEQLAYEHKVLEGLAERKEIHDPRFPHIEEKRHVGTPGEMEAESDSEESDAEDEESDSAAEEGMLIGGERVNYLDMPRSASSTTKVVMDKLYTVAIAYPDVVSDGKIDIIKEKLKMAGIEVLEETERELTIEEVKQFHASRAEEEGFDEMCDFMASGPWHIFVLTKGEFGETIIEEWQEIMGPETVADAQENQPNSYRALYGHVDITQSNAFYGSASISDAKRDSHMFFPDFRPPKLSIAHLKPAKQSRTLAIVRPDILEEYREEVIARIEAANFKIAMMKDVQMSKEEVAAFYKGHEGQPLYDELISRMSIGPMMVLVLEKEDAVEAWKTMLGPKDIEAAQIENPECLRALLALPNVTQINQLHGSDTEDQAEKEISHFFPPERTIAVIKPDAYPNKEKIMLKILEAGFRIMAFKDMVLTNEIVTGLYKNCEDKEYFGDLCQFMMSGPSLVLILSALDAVARWKECIGPTDPVAAQESAPSSIRALFGTNIMSNAIHGSSNAESALDDLHLIFGDLEFDADGNIKKKKREKVKKEVVDDGCDHEGDGVRRQESARSDNVGDDGQADGEYEKERMEVMRQKEEREEGDEHTADGDDEREEGSDDEEKREARRHDERERPSGDEEELENKENDDDQGDGGSVKLQDGEVGNLVDKSDSQSAHNSETSEVDKLNASNNNNKLAMEHDVENADESPKAAADRRPGSSEDADRKSETGSRRSRRRLDSNGDADDRKSASSAVAGSRKASAASKTSAAGKPTGDSPRKSVGDGEQGKDGPGGVTEQEDAARVKSASASSRIGSGGSPNKNETAAGEDQSGKNMERDGHDTPSKSEDAKADDAESKSVKGEMETGRPSSAAVAEHNDADEAT